MKGTTSHSKVHILRDAPLKSTVYLDRGGGAALELDQYVRGVDGLRWVGVLQRLDRFVHVARSRSVHLHRLVRPARPHEPARDVQVVDG